MCGSVQTSFRHTSEFPNTNCQLQNTTVEFHSTSFKIQLFSCKIKLFSFKIQLCLLMFCLDTLTVSFSRVMKCRVMKRCGCTVCKPCKSDNVFLSSVLTNLLSFLVFLVFLAYHGLSFRIPCLPFGLFQLPTSSSSAPSPGRYSQRNHLPVNWLESGLGTLQLGQTWLPWKCLGKFEQHDQHGKHIGGAGKFNVLVFHFS